MRFLFLFLLTSDAKCFETNACGSELYSVYHPEPNITCYNIQETDDLPVVVEDVIPENSIFFIDPSCKGGLNVREACSVEAAARLNPTRQVNVFFAGPVTRHCVESQPLASLLTYRNVNLNRIYVDDFANGTGLRHLIQNIDIDGGQYPSPYPMLYVLDLLKFITLYKCDGIYMDLDMLATRSFDELPSGDNWVGIADHTRGLLSAAIFAASTNAIGRKFAYTLIRLMDAGPVDVGSSRVMKGAVERVCGVVPFDRTEQGYSFNCHGLVLYASQFFFPVPCESSYSYFSSQLDTENVTRSFTQQLCNGFTFDKSINKQSAYAKLMSNYCPKVYDHLERMHFMETVNEEQHHNTEDTNDLRDDIIISNSEVTIRKPKKWYYEIKLTL